ncbi:MAG: LPS export ABC transporter permease LptF [Desulfococcaceae bacterium]
MKLNSVINRYLFMEMLFPFFINVMFFLFVFLLTEILQITNMIVNYNIGLFRIFRLLICTMPYFLVFVIPMSVMMSVLLTFLRMSADNEITALRSGGVSIYQLLPAVLSFCLLGCLLTGFMIMEGMPRGRASVKQITLDIAKSGIDIGLKERTFNNMFQGVMLYVNKIDMRSKELIDVFIQDERNGDAAVTVIAPRAKMFSEPEKLLFQLRLFNGTINHANLEKRSVNTVRFDTYDLTLDLRNAASGIGLGPKNEKEMKLGELQKYIQENSGSKTGRYYSALLEFHKKFSIPFACFALGILAVPLGIQSKTARKSFGLGLGLFLFLFYYLLLSAGMVFGETGKYPPLLGMWMPNIVTGGIGIFLFVRTVKGYPVYIDRIPFLLKTRKNIELPPER